MTPSGTRGRGLIWGLVAVCAVVEVVLFLGDQGVLGSERLRQAAYEWGGFWPGLLQGWRPNYPGQTAGMFFTYGFLHGGPVHMIVNMVTLWSLGHAVLDRVGPWGFVGLYGASLLGGAAGFGLIAETFRPMVGASGALFGLAGGLLAWNYVDRFTFREGALARGAAGAVSCGDERGDVVGAGRATGLGDASGRLPRRLGRGAPDRPARAGSGVDSTRPQTDKRTSLSSQDRRTRKTAPASRGRLLKFEDCVRLCDGSDACRPDHQARREASKLPREAGSEQHRRE